MTASPALRSLTVAALAAAVVAVGLYIFGTQHTPDYSTSLFGETRADTFELKSWLATGVLAFAAVQLGLGALDVRAAALDRRRPAAASVPSTGRSAPLADPADDPDRLPLRLRLRGADQARHPRRCPLDRRLLPLRRLRGQDRPRADRRAGECRVGRCRWSAAPLSSLVAVLWYTSALWYFNDFKLP